MPRRCAAVVNDQIDADTAFELLRWRSQETNVKLRVLAEQLAADFRALDYEQTLPPRSMYDQLLLTAQLRISGADEAIAGAAS
jgi:hypothetical protein